MLDSTIYVFDNYLQNEFSIRQNGTCPTSDDGHEK